MATTRLRKTFRYPTDEDSDDPVEGIDEEGPHTLARILHPLPGTLPPNARAILTRPPEQEKLIQTLHTTDAAKTRLYTTLLLPLPLLPTLLYLPRLTTSLPAASLSAAAIASLLATAYILYYVPHAPETAGSRRPGSPDASGSVRRHVVPLNGVLSAVLAVREGLAGTGWREGLAGGGGYVPACKFVAAFSSSPSFCVSNLRLRLPSRQEKLYA
jgi:hypothetical protein